MTTKMKTTGDLRVFLAETMEQVRAGTIDAGAASQVAKLAGRLTESFTAEVQSSHLRQVTLGEKAGALGSVKLGDNSKQA